MKASAALEWKDYRLQIVSSTSQCDLAKLEHMIKPVDITLGNGSVLHYSSIESLKDEGAEFLSVKE